MNLFKICSLSKIRGPFLGVSVKGEYFFKSIDTTGIEKFVEYIAKNLVVATNEIGGKKVEQVVMNNAPNCRKACKLVEETTCVAHGIDLVLEDCGKLHWIKSTFGQGKHAIKFSP